MVRLRLHQGGEVSSDEEINTCLRIGTLGMVILVPIIFLLTLLAYLGV